MKHSAILPRIIRIGEAPAYLGMSRTLFDVDVRPSLTIVRIGTHGLAVDRLELDAWADALFERQHALAAVRTPMYDGDGSERPDEKGGPWGVRERRASSAAVASGTSNGV